MAQLAFGVVGAAIGSSFGMPSLGFAVGSMIGGMLFPTPGVNTVGPQMGDLSVTSSAYGADIPYGFGTMRVAGNVIWASPIQQVQNTSTTSSGGGGKGKGGLTGSSSSTTTVYTYYGNWAVGFACGPAESVTRIWFDGVLVYDILDSGGIDPGGIPGAPSPTGNSTVFLNPGSPSYPGLNFRFYAGDEVQVADPLIESWMAIGDVSPPETQGQFASGSTPSQVANEPATVTPGSQAVPGFRGLCYIVFEDWCLTNSGNHIPMVTAEINFAGSSSSTAYPVQPMVPNSDPRTNNGLGEGQINIPAGIAVDTQRNVGFRAYSDEDPTVSSLRRFELDDMTELLIQPISKMVAPDTAEFGFILDICMGLDGFLYVDGPTLTGGATPVFKVDPNSCTSVGNFNLGHAAGGGWGMCSGVDPGGVLHYYLAIGDQGTSQLVDVADMVGVGAFTPAKGVCLGMVPDLTRSMKSSAPGIIVYGPSPEVQLNAGGTLDFYTIDPMNGVGTAELLISYGAGELASFLAAPPASLGSVILGATGIWADTANTSVIVGVTLANAVGDLGDQLLLSWSAVHHGLNWVIDLSQGIPGVDTTNTPLTLPVSLPNNSQSNIQSSLSAPQLAWATGDGVTGAMLVIVDTTEGTAKFQQWPTSGVTTGAQVYNGVMQSVISQTWGASVTGSQIYLNRAAGGSSATTVGPIVQYLCQLAGLQSSDLDTSQIDGIPIAGYFVGQPTSPRNAILPLAQCFLFDAVESDGVIVFKLRSGQSVVRTLYQESDLAPVDAKTNLVVLETRQQEVDLPVYLAVSYYDVNNNYQQGTRIRRRSAVPLQNEPAAGTAQNAPTVYTQNVAVLQWPIVLDAASATAAADHYLYSTWMERTSYKQSLQWQHLDLDPSDLVLVQLDDGTTFTERLTKLVVGADLTIECDGVAHNSAIYESAPPGGNDFKIVQVGGSGSAFTKLTMLPLPLLQDSDSVGPSNSLMYYVASNYDSSPWPGCQVNESSDLVNWVVVDNDAAKGTFGTTGNTLPFRTNPFTWDNTAEFLVYINSGQTLSPATDEELLAGANMMAVQNTDGNFEIIQFGNAHQQSDGSWLLTHLLRGRRGTDAFALNHGTGLPVALLPLASTHKFAIGLSDLGQVRYFKGVGVGTQLSTADLVTLTPPGNDLMPWAPVHVEVGSPGISWDPTFDAASYSFSTALEPNDTATNAVPGTSPAVVRTQSAVPANTRAYVEFDRGFLEDNDTSWGFCGAAFPATGSNLGGAGSAQVVKAIDVSEGTDRLCMAFNTYTNLAWWRLDDGAWVGAGGLPGDPTAGTNGVDISGAGSSFYLAWCSFGQNESDQLYGAAADQIYPPPNGYTAGVPSSDLVISWIRRTRIGGQLSDGTGTVPLNESAEAYEVDILSGPNGSVKRTLTVGSPTATYTAAQIAADFGTMPVQLTVEVYQMSGVVGRGFATQITRTIP